MGFFLISIVIYLLNTIGWNYGHNGFLNKLILVKISTFIKLNFL